MSPRISPVLRIGSVLNGRALVFERVMCSAVSTVPRSGTIVVFYSPFPKRNTGEHLEYGRNIEYLLQAIEG